MPLSKGLTLQDFAAERDRAKRTLVRKQDNLAGVRSIHSKFEGRLQVEAHCPQPERLAPWSLFSE